MFPVHKDYRTTNDGVYVADIGFKKQLWTLDPELDVVWDWGSQKWEIWKFPGQPKKINKKMDEKAYHVMTIQTKNRTFRELGADILLRMQQLDPNKIGYDGILNYLEKLDENRRRAREKELEEKFGSISREVGWFFRGHRVQVPEKFAIIKVPRIKRVIGALSNA
jgi:hypothetical protein